MAKPNTDGLPIDVGAEVVATVSSPKRAVPRAATSESDGRAEPQHWKSLDDFVATERRIRDRKRERAGGGRRGAGDRSFRSGLLRIYSSRSRTTRNSAASTSSPSSFGNDLFLSHSWRGHCQQEKHRIIAELSIDQVSWHAPAVSMTHTSLPLSHFQHLLTRPCSVSQSSFLSVL